MAPKSNALARPDLSALVAKPVGGEVAELPTEVLQRVADLLQDAPMLAADMGQLLNRIMDCTTLDEISAIYGGLDSTDDVVGLPLLIESFAINASDFDSPGSLPFYAIVNGRTNDAMIRPVTFNTGSTTILITLLTANRRDWFPFTAHIERKELPNGHVAYNMVFDA